MDAAIQTDSERLALIRSMDLLNAIDAPELDRIVQLVAHAFSMPIVLITLVNRDELVLICRTGLALDHTDRASSICTYTIEQRDVLEIEDLSKSARFARIPLVRNEPWIRYYAGAPLIAPAGCAIGTLCLIDYAPRRLHQEDRARLKAYAALVIDQLWLRRSIGRIEAVTGLPNRQQFQADMAALESATAQEATLLWIEVLNVQNMYVMAQSKGPRPLEMLIRQAADRAREAIPGGIELYHVGVTRFAAVLDEPMPLERDELLDRIVGRFREPFNAEGLEVRVTLRIGVVPFRHRQWHDVVRQGICALHDAIERDRSWCLYDEDYDARNQRRMQIASDALRGLEENQFRLVYQPRYDVREGGFRKVEALVRWHHPTLGELSPGEFVPLIESTALMPRLTDWVLERALAQLGQWRAAGMQVKSSINLSAADFLDGLLPQRLQSALQQHRIDPGLLELEVTEGAWLDPDRGAAAQLAEIRDWGVRVFIDDFGAGFCNFGYLNRLPIDGLKIDRALVSGVDADPARRAVARAIIQMAHAMRLVVVAEGVETDGELAAMRDEGCEEIQGYYLAPPLPAAALRLRLETGTGAV